MTILADEAGPLESADEAALSRQAKQAEERLGLISFYDDEYPDVQNELDILRARLSASELKRSLSNRGG
jgi:F0F1-type ATP synthase epsilon subunit